MNAKSPTQPQPPEKKRASPVPEPETAALRAVRNVRQLNEQIVKIKAKAVKQVDEKRAERDAIIGTLSPEAKEIFGKFSTIAKDDGALVESARE